MHDAATEVYAETDTAAATKLCEERHWFPITEGIGILHEDYSWRHTFQWNAAVRSAVGDYLTAPQGHGSLPAAGLP